MVKVVICNGKHMLFKKSTQKSGYGETTFTVNYNASSIPITTFLSRLLEKHAFSLINDHFYHFSCRLLIVAAGPEHWGEL